MKLEAGKYYRTRDGRKVGPMNVPPKKSHWSSIVVADCNGKAWLKGGVYFSDIPDPLDLIAEWTDEPEQPTTGTLAELNVKPGDVVEYIPSGNYHVVAQNKHIKSTYGINVPYISQWDTVSEFRIISRASQSTTPSPDVATPPYTGLTPTPLTHSTTPHSPVRTVTRKEIVPGQYGLVTIDDGAVRMDYWLPDEDDIADLTAAINTLTEIRDALENT